eukprot:1145209-Pelagomonas_calceolata.AAC.4
MPAMLTIAYYPCAGAALMGTSLERALRGLGSGCKQQNMDEHTMSSKLDSTSWSRPCVWLKLCQCKYSGVSHTHNRSLGSKAPAAGQIPVLNLATYPASFLPHDFSQCTHHDLAQRGA